MAAAKPILKGPTAPKGPSYLEQKLIKIQNQILANQPKPSPSIAQLHPSVRSDLSSQEKQQFRADVYNEKRNAIRDAKHDQYLRNSTFAQEILSKNYGLYSVILSRDDRQYIENAAMIQNALSAKGLKGSAGSVGLKGVYEHLLSKFFINAKLIVPKDLVFIFNKIDGSREVPVMDAWKPRKIVKVDSTTGLVQTEDGIQAYLETTALPAQQFQKRVQAYKLSHPYL